MPTDQKKEAFGKIRSLLWPIHRDETKKILLIFFLFFLASLNYHLLRVTKDAIIVTAPQSGAEVLPFLKSFAMLPLAFGMMVGFTFLSRFYNRETIFYAFIGSFIFFMLLFALVLYPLREPLSPDCISNYLSTMLPRGLHGLIMLIKHWIFTIYYVVAESWNGFTIAILLWGFVNDVTDVAEARRSYAIFGMGINVAGIVAGHGANILITTLSKADVHPIFSFLGCKCPWDQTFFIILAIIIIICLFLIVIYRFLHIIFFPNRRHLCIVSNDQKRAPSILSIFKYVLQDRYLVTISLIVISYYLVNNITEILWIAQLKELFPQVENYAAYMSKITFYTGIIATVSSFLISGNIIRQFGWKKAALVTPLIVLIFSILFFYFLFLNNYSLLTSFWGKSTLFLSVLFGSIQNCLMRATKYTLFDETKEMAFIPLNPESKIQGKLAIDGLGSHFGKSGSSIFIQIFIVLSGSATAAFPFFAGITFFILSGWLFGIHFLGKRFESTQAIQRN